MGLPPTLVALAALAAAAGLVWLFRRDGARRKRQRGVLFADCLELFQSFRVTQEGPAYPVLAGRYRGFEVRLEPVVDDLAVRKVPSLWLKTTVLAPNPVRGVFDLMMRPQGAEVYSPSGDLAHRLAVPAGWPDQAVICTDDPATLPDLDRLAPHVAAFEEPQMKELLITPRGTRVVRQLRQADRARYGVLRQAEFGEVRLDPALARRLLDYAIAVSAALQPRTGLKEAS
ncbi:MAG: hypothetical protein JWQ97_2228 [Phenylobacterium sp.]|nr:hypothetical protein [Phenylobacterium sp.]